MNHKTLIRMFSFCLAAILLAVNVSGAAASPQSAPPSAKLFTLSPTGGDDTANFQQAFEQAAAAGSGSTVQLAAGVFHTRVIEVWNFDGTLKGTGQKATIIERFVDKDGKTMIDAAQMPALFHFYRGNVRITDLSLNMTPATPCWPYLFGGYNNPALCIMAIL